MGRGAFRDGFNFQDVDFKLHGMKPHEEHHPRNSKKNYRHVFRSLLADQIGRFGDQPLPRLADDSVLGRECPNINYNPIFNPAMPSSSRLSFQPRSINLSRTIFENRRINLTANLSAYGSNLVPAHIGCVIASAPTTYF